MISGWLLYLPVPVLLIAIAAPAISDVLGTMHNVAQDMNASKVRK